MSIFCHAVDATPDVFEALGPNGHVIMSGYDLGEQPPGIPSLPETYKVRLAEAVELLRQNAGPNGRFSIALPAAASTMEFQRYEPAGGAPSVEGHRALPRGGAASAR